jgi:hypothetical protein
LNIGLQASYQLTAWLTALGAYSFFDQRTGAVGTAAAGSSAAASHVYQNRIFLGLQFGYPVRLD